MDILKQAVQQREQGKKAVLAQVVETQGSVPRKAGARMLILENGQTLGTIGGGAIEKKIVDYARSRLGLQDPELLKFDLDKDAKMMCGGKMTVFLEPISPNPHLIIFGAGHIGRALVWFCSQLDFSITILDNRKEVDESITVPEIRKYIGRPYEESMKQLYFTKNAYIVIVTHKHLHDQQVLDHCINQPFKYLGMIGSKTKVKQSFDKLREKGIDDQLIAQIHAPIGLDIGANTPEEIALAIAAEMVAVKTGVPVRSKK